MHGRTLVLAGPGLPAADGDLALVPVHPQTGEHWPVAEPVKPVPLAWDAWRYLAFHPCPEAAAHPRVTVSSSSGARGP